MQTNVPIDPVSDAISRATYLIEEARLATIQLDIQKAKAYLIEAASILNEANEKMPK